jgi:hypothetical protein
LDVADRLTNAYARAIAELEESVSDPDMPERAARAYDEYSGMLADASSEPLAVEANHLFEIYRAVIRNGFRGEESAARVRETYQTYLKEAKAALVDMDPASLSPADLITIGQSLAGLGWLIESSQEGAVEGPPHDADESGNNGRGGALWGSMSILESPGTPKERS